MKRTGVLKQRSAEARRAKVMRALRWIAYSTLVGFLLGFGLLALGVRGASADTPGNSTFSGPVVDSGAANAIAAVPDDGATTTSYYATSPYYNPYYQSYSYSNPYYNPYYNYYAYYSPTYNPYYNYYYSHYHNYTTYPYYYSSSGSWTYCTIPGGGSVWVPYGQSTAGLVCY
jgi:hypothetical protein